MDVNNLPDFVSSVYAESSMDSSTKMPRKIKTVSRVIQKLNTTGIFHYISNSDFKRNSHLCWSVKAKPSFIAYDDKRFAKKLDRYTTTSVFKDGRRCKYII